MARPGKTRYQRLRRCQRPHYKSKLFFVTFEQLLDKDRKKRLGYINDVDEVLGHSFFKDIDLEKLIKK